jgi:hypothetical protein
MVTRLAAALLLFFATLAPACAAPQAQLVGLTAVWANSGEDKVTQDELRVTTDANAGRNRIWSGSAVVLRAARNETVAFNLVLEAATAKATGLSVSLKSLVGPNGKTLASRPYDGNPARLFNWVGREIELFHVRYLAIKGISRLCYEDYDERHIPAKLRRPFDALGIGAGNWADRPNHDKFYPDIAVPLELKPSFDIEAGRNQSIWVDVFVPKTAGAGTYRGNIEIAGRGNKIAVPVYLYVANFTLPDEPGAKTMLVHGDSDIAQRYGALTTALADRHYLVAHRHKISLIDNGVGVADHPPPEWIPRLNGSLFTAAQGYDGPGIATGNGVYSIGTYGSWQGSWDPQSMSAMWDHTNRWEDWFRLMAPRAERFLYLIDESSDYPQTETWARWMNSNPGIGKNLRSFATIDAPSAKLNTPSLDIAASGGGSIGITSVWNAAASYFQGPGKQLMLYNGSRPGTGSFCTEDEGTSLRMIPWAQFKRGIKRWFYWESTYYTNFQCYGYTDPRGRTNVFRQAQTFGCDGGFSEPRGRTGWNYSNGDGVLFYPGTEKLYPADSYNIPGPIASLRLKHWRRGIQDADYLALAAAIDPVRVQQIVQRMVPKVAWEYGVANPADPTWVRTNISWSTYPDNWDRARAELAAIIEGVARRVDAGPPSPLGMRADGG